MLHPIIQEIAETFGYIPFTEEEGSEQFQATITYIQGETKRTPKSGDVKQDSNGTYWCYWKPKYDEEDLEGWYEVPSNEDIEEWSFDSICCTPGEDEVEPDHPDSWLRLLSMI
jgi:hypothetical protein